jgi:hypothetical protein
MSVIGAAANAGEDIGTGDFEKRELGIMKARGIGVRSTIRVAPRLEDKRLSRSIDATASSAVAFIWGRHVMVDSC